MGRSVKEKEDCLRFRRVRRGVLKEEPTLRGWDCFLPPSDSLSLLLSSHSLFFLKMQHLFELLRFKNSLSIVSEVHVTWEGGWEGRVTFIISGVIDKEVVLFWGWVMVIVLLPVLLVRWVLEEGRFDATEGEEAGAAKELIFGREGTVVLVVAEYWI